MDQWRDSDFYSLFTKDLTLIHFNKYTLALALILWFTAGFGGLSIYEIKQILNNCVQKKNNKT